MKIIVIGAGLAGAACAHALALRGCDVTVLETNTAAASAKSHAALHSTSAPSAGLPVALMAPHHSSGDSAISQLSRLGIDATTQAAYALLVRGRDWQPCGALQRAGKLAPHALWQSEGAWVQPAALVAAWLAHPRITLLSGAAVQRLGCSLGAQPVWQAWGGGDRLLAEGDAMVLANAHGAQSLFNDWASRQGKALPDPITSTPNAVLALHQVAGQVVYGPWTPDWQALWPRLLPELAELAPALAGPAGGVPSSPDLPDWPICAVNGNGHFIPAVPWGDGDAGTIWLSGSTYEHDTVTPQATPQGLLANLARLQQLIPAATELLAAQHRAGLLRGWAGVRCTTRDRLPAVGAMSGASNGPSGSAPGLYLCTAMGSRGLSFAAVCGEHLAASITGTPSPLPDHLQRAIAAQRLYSQVLRHNKTSF